MSGLDRLMQAILIPGGEEFVASVAAVQSLATLPGVYWATEEQKCPHCGETLAVMNGLYVPEFECHNSEHKHESVKRGDQVIYVSVPSSVLVDVLADVTGHFIENPACWAGVNTGYQEAKEKENDNG